MPPQPGIENVSADRDTAAPLVWIAAALAALQVYTGCGGDKTTAPQDDNGGADRLFDLVRGALLLWHG